MAFKPISIAQPANSLRSSDALSKAVSGLGDSFSQLGGKYQEKRVAEDTANLEQMFQDKTLEETNAILEANPNLRETSNFRGNTTQYNSILNSVDENAISYETTARTRKDDSAGRELQKLLNLKDVTGAAQYFNEYSDSFTSEENIKAGQKAVTDATSIAIEKDFGSDFINTNVDRLIEKNLTSATQTFDNLSETGLKGLVELSTDNTIQFIAGVPQSQQEALKDELEEANNNIETNSVDPLSKFALETEVRENILEKYPNISETDLEKEVKTVSDHFIKLSTLTDDEGTLLTEQLKEEQTVFDIEAQQLQRGIDTYISLNPTDELKSPDAIVKELNSLAEAVNNASTDAGPEAQAALTQLIKSGKYNPSEIQYLLTQSSDKGDNAWYAWRQDKEIYLDDLQSNIDKYERLGTDGKSETIAEYTTRVATDVTAMQDELTKKTNANNIIKERNRKKYTQEILNRRGKTKTGVRNQVTTNTPFAIRNDNRIFDLRQTNNTGPVTGPVTSTNTNTNTNANANANANTSGNITPIDPNGIAATVNTPGVGRLGSLIPVLNSNPYTSAATKASVQGTIQSITNAPNGAANITGLAAANLPGNPKQKEVAQQNINALALQILQQNNFNSKGTLTEAEVLASPEFAEVIQEIDEAVKLPFNDEITYRLQSNVDRVLEEGLNITSGGGMSSTVKSRARGNKQLQQIAVDALKAAGISNPNKNKDLLNKTKDEIAEIYSNTSTERAVKKATEARNKVLAKEQQEFDDNNKERAKAGLEPLTQPKNMTGADFSANVLGAPVDVVSAGLRAVGVPVSNSPFLGSNNLKNIFNPAATEYNNSVPSQQNTIQVANLGDSTSSNFVEQVTKIFMEAEGFDAVSRMDTNDQPVIGSGIQYKLRHNDEMIKEEFENEPLTLAAILSGTITEAQNKRLMPKLIATAQEDLRRVFPEYDTFPNDIKVAITDMMLNKGQSTFVSSSPKFIKYMKAGDYESAKNELEGSENKARNRNQLLAFGGNP